MEDVIVTMTFNIKDQSYAARLIIDSVTELDNPEENDHKMRLFAHTVLNTIRRKNELGRNKTEGE